MWVPPFTEIVDPVMKSASSAVRNNTARAMTSARPSRPTGMLARSLPLRAKQDRAERLQVDEAATQ